MAILECEFYCSARGPAPADEDTWQLVFDQNAKRLFVRHEWHAARHAGTDEFTLDEFLIQGDAASEALLALLFGRVTAEASWARVGYGPSPRSRLLGREGGGVRAGDHRPQRFHCSVRWMHPIHELYECGPILRDAKSFSAPRIPGRDPAEGIILQ
jgi:hypothetical protein